LSEPWLPFSLPLWPYKQFLPGKMLVSQFGQRGLILAWKSE
jgi:hypothetical protein